MLDFRSTHPDDTDSLLAIARGTGVFKPHELIALEEVLDDYHAVNEAEGHQSITLVESERVLGFSYFAPVAMTDHTWEVWWIAVTKFEQGRGLGREILTQVEERVRQANGRLLLIETSSLPEYHPTRQFYLRLGYELAAKIPDFYHDGDDKLIYWKKLRSTVA